jgi:hypothetical protein
MMADLVTYEGHSGLLAIAHALNDVRQKLQNSEIQPQHAAGILGCMNLHLAQIIGAGGEFMKELEDCAGLLCPECSGYLGLVSDLSSCCYHCGERFLASADEPVTTVHAPHTHAASAHMAHHAVRPHADSESTK